MISIIFIAIAVILLLALWPSFRRKCFAFSGHEIRMTDAPGMFWFWVSVHVLAIAVCVVTAVLAWGNGGSQATDPKRQQVSGKERELDLGRGVKMRLCWIPPGEFIMGSDNREHGELLPHKVTITNGFWMGKFEVTVEQWRSVVTNWGDRWQFATNSESALRGNAQSPASRMSWDDAVLFCQDLSKRTGVKVALPTEAEWEYACRAGTTNEYCSGNGEKSLAMVAWYGERSAHPVGKKDANRWGLHDMHGNVGEWCADIIPSADDDPAVIDQSEMHERVFRGGAYEYQAIECRAVSRIVMLRCNHDATIGMRVVVREP